MKSNQMRLNSFNVIVVAFQKLRWFVKESVFRLFNYDSVLIGRFSRGNMLDINLIGVPKFLKTQ